MLKLNVKIILAIFELCIASSWLVFLQLNPCHATFLTKLILYLMLGEMCALRVSQDGDKNCQGLAMGSNAIGFVKLIVEMLAAGGGREGRC